MKKKTKKLVLAKETVRDLTNGLEWVLGGNWSADDPCNNTSFRNPCDLSNGPNACDPPVTTYPSCID